MPDYPNPYSFVPLENTQVNRRRWDPDHDGVERWHQDRYSGRFYCVAHPETPLFIHDEGAQVGDDRRFRRIGGRPGIPASTLKGAIRSIYEIVSDSCLSTLSENYKITKERAWVPHTVAFPESYRPCTKLDSGCPACLAFGMVERKKDNNNENKASGSGAEGTPLAGRISLSHATPVRPKYEKLSLPKAGGGPHPWHKAFYFEEGGDASALGRKLYYHHRDYRQTIALYGTGGRPGLMLLEVHSGDFTFEVDFINLTEDELAFLTYSLVLEESLRHKLGYGKPYGLGSIKFKAERVELWQTPQCTGTEQFLRWQATPVGDYDLAFWQKKGKELWLSRKGARPAYEAFSKLLAWPGVSLYKYPSYQWFHDPSHDNRVITLAGWQANPGRQGPIVADDGRVGSSSAPPGARLRGRVVQFSAESGFGFIEVPNQARGLFVHINNVRGKVVLKPGQEVEYSIGPGRKGDEAKDVIVISPGGRR